MPMSFTHAIRAGLITALKTVVWLAKIMIPVSLVVGVLRDTGVLQVAAGYLEPMLRLVGLRGEGAMVLLSSIVLNLYASIAAMSLVPFTLREMTILAVMTLVAHNFLVELAVTEKTGTPALRMAALRLIAAFAIGAVLNVLLPAQMGTTPPGAPSGSIRTVETTPPSGGAPAILTLSTAGPWITTWALDTARLMARITVIVVILMVVIRTSEFVGLDRWTARRLKPLMRVFGLPEAVALPWLVANTLGLAYGAAVLNEAAQNGSLTREDGDLLNHHLGISHSILEDTLLFVAIGIPAVWIVVPRVAAAMISVYERRIERHIRQRRAALTAAG